MKQQRQNKFLGYLKNVPQTHNVTEDKATVDRLLLKVIELEIKENIIYKKYIMPSLKETVLNRYKKWYKGEQYSRKLTRLENL